MQWSSQKEEPRWLSGSEYSGYGGAMVSGSYRMARCHAAIEDCADVSSWGSGYPDFYGEVNKKRARRVDETIGNQAGFMATRSLIEYFHNQIDYFHSEACPGGFLPP
ncbi:hypothetical protein ACHAWX_005385, partial [Stephanocyclus meneghinianus]